MDQFFRDFVKYLSRCLKINTDERTSRRDTSRGVPLSVVCDVSRLREVACGSLNSSSDEWDATTILRNCAISRYRKSRLSNTTCGAGLGLAPRWLERNRMTIIKWHVPL
ncbi:hypothetical protein PUN28_008468 [Cardiocondyla obscurior]|uniref:Uncharacterized protein n=1 Tax=Cardiocondyla obscurior TaxID=286306 RepID=A0AAW2G434_9HYME